MIGGLVSPQFSDSTRMLVHFVKSMFVFSLCEFDYNLTYVQAVATRRSIGKNSPRVCEGGGVRGGGVRAGW